MQFSPTNESRMSSPSSIRSSERKKKRPRCHSCMTSLGDVNHCSTTSSTSSPLRKKIARGVELSAQENGDELLCMDIDIDPTSKIHKHKEVTVTSNFSTTPKHSTITQEQQTMLPGIDTSRGPPVAPPMNKKTEAAQDAPPRSLAPPPMMNAMPNMRHLHSRNSMAAMNAVKAEKKNAPSPNVNVFVPRAPVVAQPQPQQVRCEENAATAQSPSWTAPTNTPFPNQGVPYPQGSGFGAPPESPYAPPSAMNPTSSERANVPMKETISYPSSSSSSAGVLDSSWFYALFITVLLFSQSVLTGYDILQIGSSKVSPIYIQLLQKLHTKESSPENESDLSRVNTLEQQIIQKEEEARSSYIQRKARELADVKIQQQRQVRQTEEEERVIQLLQSPLPAYELPLELESNIASLQEMLEEWEDSLSRAENVALESPEIHVAIQQLQEVSIKPVPIPFQIESITIPWKDCPSVNIEPLNYLTRQEFETVHNEVKSLLQSASDIIQTNETYQHQLFQWIQNEFSNIIMKENTQEQFSLTDIQKTIDSYQITQEKRVDYASRQYGATILSSQTSPSLKDTLPLWNKVMSFFKIRFYGYGPQMALQHSKSIGQCWSFEKDSQSSLGQYATLSIKLPQTINIHSVVLHHPPTNQMETAIQTFRLFCSSESTENASLGTFQYNILSPYSKQEFIVEDNECDQVMIGIDSNWGGRYTCLYKISVFGDIVQNIEDE